MSWGRMRSAGKTPRPKPVPPPTPTPVVLIDEDDADDDPEVFIINEPAEIARAAAACNTKKGNSSGSNVINLDDDDDEDEQAGAGAERAGPSAAGAGGSPATATPPGRASTRNRYGLNYVSDSEQSDLSEGSDSDSDEGGNGSSDCEILPPVSARKVWESAASRRATPRAPPRRKDGRASTSASSAESSTHHDESLDGLFASGCPLDGNFWEHDGFWDYYAYNPAGPSDTSGSKYGAGTSSVPSTHKSPMDDVSNGKETEDLNRACNMDCDIASNDEAAHSHEGPVPEKAPETSHPPHQDETLTPEADTGLSFVSKNRVFPECSADWKDNNPIFVSTPERMDEGIPEGPLKDLVDDPEKLGLSVIVQDSPDLEDGIIGDREKHKESDEYKRATEEEWASRQRQLAIQAEEAKEAKRLRKRKKAEALRLLDMEKRQKQRIEEVRETERKREEDIQLKEQCRGAVRLELENMERRCRDVSSVLRALGIPVEGGEVKAYKQALLKFHPDRVSRTDMYQQVKAEETFKFISRFKEKLKL